MTRPTPSTMLAMAAELRTAASPSHEPTRRLCADAADMLRDAALAEPEPTDAVRTEPILDHRGKHIGERRLDPLHIPPDAPLSVPAGWMRNSHTYGAPISGDIEFVYGPTKPDDSDGWRPLFPAAPDIRSEGVHPVKKIVAWLRDWGTKNGIANSWNIADRIERGEYHRSEGTKEEEA